MKLFYSTWVAITTSCHGEIADVIDKATQNSCGSVINKVNTQKVNERVQSGTGEAPQVLQ